MSKQAKIDFDRMFILGSETETECVLENDSERENKCEREIERERYCALEREIKREQ